MKLSLKCQVWITKAALGSRVWGQPLWLIQDLFTVHFSLLWNTLLGFFHSILEIEIWQSGSDRLTSGWQIQCKHASLTCSDLGMSWTTRSCHSWPAHHVPRLNAKANLKCDSSNRNLKGLLTWLMCCLATRRFYHASRTDWDIETIETSEVLAVLHFSQAFSGAHVSIRSPASRAGITLHMTVDMRRDYKSIQKRNFNCLQLKL